MIALKLAAGVVGGLAIGMTIGVFIGRWTAERQWSKPLVVLTPADEKRSASDDADPTPKAGVTNDPVAATTVSIGAGEYLELHVVIENRGKCKLTAMSGVAYGFDARGRSSVLNKHGEHYVAFSDDKLSLEPGGHTTVALKLRYADEATLGAAHVDATKCADGTSWKRP